MTRREFLSGLGALALAAPRLVRAQEKRKPNIVFIFADDMGYGDARCFNPDSKIPTPNIDGLAAQGIRFTDAHAPVGLCVPSRYGLLTGRYPFRSQRYRLRDGETTFASVLKAAGYRTAMVGKWHLSFRYPPGTKGQRDVKANAVLRNGPVDRGFDSYFGIPASLDIPPYYYIENDRVVAPPTNKIAESHSPGVRNIQGAFWRAGGIAPGYKHDEVLPKFIEKSLAVLDDNHKTAKAQPFFLYVALAAPHTPWLPTGKFRGSTKVGDYGDFIAQVDDGVGQVLKRLEQLGFADDTLVFFSSDNGPVWYAEDVKRYGHSSTGALRGMKADAWEGGNRMPFIARWPGKVVKGSTSDETICFTDMIATFADIVGTTLPADAGEDSVSILPVLLGKKLNGPLREATVLQGGRGMFAIRQGKWKLILGGGSGGFSRRVHGKAAEGEGKGQLYDLHADVSESVNLYEKHPEVVERLTQLLDRYKKQGRSVPRP